LLKIGPTVLAVFLQFICRQNKKGDL